MDSFSDLAIYLGALYRGYQSLWPGVTTWDGWTRGEMGIVYLLVILYCLKDR